MVNLEIRKPSHEDTRINNFEDDFIIAISSSDTLVLTGISKTTLENFVRDLEDLVKSKRKRKAYLKLKECDFSKAGDE